MLLKESAKYFTNVLNILTFFIFLCVKVCEVYRLHRETYYLAVDFVDRYLSVKHDIAKQRLQLVGTTALFIAAKLEVRISFKQLLL